MKFKVTPSEIKNKIKRSQVYARQQEIKRKIKRQHRDNIKKEEEKDPSKKEERLRKNIPNTLENTREFDETMVDADDDEVFADEATDEFASFFTEGKEPKILVTTNKQATKVGFAFAEELSTVFTDADYVRRQSKQDIKHICKQSNDAGYTDVIIVNEDHKECTGMTIIHLPHGPTARFRLSSVKRCKQIYNKARPSAYKPELILNNFNTRLGHSVGRMFVALFPHGPEFEGRQVITLHNQRDFIFFRRHRYQFVDGKKCNLQEMGPRFTLKLQTLQKGTFDMENGEFEFIRKSKIDGRKKFYL